MITEYMSSEGNDTINRCLSLILKICQMAFLVFIIEVKFYSQQLNPRIAILDFFVFKCHLHQQFATFASISVTANADRDLVVRLGSLLQELGRNHRL
jgi:hypothetical protein